MIHLQVQRNSLKTRAMKYFAAIVFLLSMTGITNAQSWESKYENAHFENRVNGHEAYTSIVKKIAGEFTKAEFNSIQNRCQTKEGVFRVEISDDKSTITIYYLNWIDQVTINWLFTEAVPELESSLRIHEKVVFTF